MGTLGLVGECVHSAAQRVAVLEQGRSWGGYARRAVGDDLVGGEKARGGGAQQDTRGLVVGPVIVEAGCATRPRTTFPGVEQPAAVGLQVVE